MQIVKLIDLMPISLEAAREQIEQYPVGEQVMNYLSTSGAWENLQTITSVFLKSTFGFFGDIYVIIVAGIYFTVDPLLYQRGMIRLLPPFPRGRGNDAGAKMGDNLEQWVPGPVISMVVIFSLVEVGVWSSRLRTWFTLS